jgi:cytochrome c oxidase subunit 4
MSDSHAQHTAPYKAIFIALCICTVASILADVYKPDSKALLIVIVLAIATVKALFVMAFFMHLKFEGKWKYVLLAPTIILACGIPLALTPDIGVHYYIDVAPQFEQKAQASDATEHEPEHPADHPPAAHP